MSSLKCFLFFRHVLVGSYWFWWTKGKVYFRSISDFKIVTPLVPGVINFLQELCLCVTGGNVRDWWLQQDSSGKTEGGKNSWRCIFNCSSLHHFSPFSRHWGKSALLNINKKWSRIKQTRRNCSYTFVFFSSYISYVSVLVKLDVACLAWE